MNLTAEDIEIFQTIAPELSATVEGDNIDARAMMAREVWKERAWRTAGWIVKPSDCVKAEIFRCIDGRGEVFDGPAGRSLREQIEAECGEVLA